MSSIEDLKKWWEYNVHIFLLFGFTGILMLIYYIDSIEKRVIENHLYQYTLLIGFLIATFITFSGVVVLAYMLLEGWRLIVSFIHESRRVVVEGLRKCQQYYLCHSRGIASIGTILRKLVTASLYISILAIRDSDWFQTSGMQTLRQSQLEGKGCYCPSSIGQGFYIIFSIWWAVVAGADYMAYLERKLLGTQYHSAKFWSVESLIYFALGTYLWPVTVREKACERDVVFEASVLLILFFCFVAVYTFTIESWPSLGVVDFFRSCITITKQSWRRLWSVSDTPQDSNNNISQCVHEHDTDQDTDPLVLSTCKSICCRQCFNACRDSDQRIYCPQHLALGPQQLHPLRSSHTECCMCNGDDGLLDTPCGHPVCTTCVTRVARGRVQAFGRNRVNGRVTRISETDYHCECCFPLGPDPSPPTVADLLASRLNDHRPSLIH